MKRTTIILFSSLLVIGLVACGNKVPEVSSYSAKESDTIESDGFDTPLEMQLMLGMVKLDETAYAIDSEQAADLIPLWKALRSLVNSDTAALIEVDAIVNQIQDTMTDDQMKAINEMSLSLADMAGVAEVFGIELGFGGGKFGDLTPEMQATVEAMRESGEFPGGGGVPGGRPGFGGGQGFGGVEMDPSVRETAMAERGGSFNRGFGINTALLDAIIAFLEAKIQ